MRQDFILSTNLGSQIDLHEGTHFHVAHGGEEAGPNLEGLNCDGLFGVEAVPAHLLELDAAHHVFEENGEFFLVRVVDHLGKVNDNGVLLAFFGVGAFDFVADHFVAVQVFVEGYVKSKMLFQLLGASFDDCSLHFASVVGDFGLKFDGVFHNVAVLVLYLHSVKVGHGAAVVRLANWSCWFGR